MPHLFCFGLGYSAQVLAERLAAKGWHISGTSRNVEGVEAIAARGWRALAFDGTAPMPGDVLDGVTHILSSVPPTASGEPVLAAAGDALRAHASKLRWFGYLSTTGVYGDTEGGWVDEGSPLAPSTDRGHRRLAAETAWMDLHRTSGLPVHLFRLPGIYGPGRNQLESVLDGTAKRIVKPGQIFSRIHVDDIAGALEASIAAPRAGAAYNVADDEPAPPQDVVAYAAELLGRVPPAEVALEDANLSPMALSFYAESKRVSNRLMKEELGYRLRYPTYREGLTALLSGLKRRT